MGRARRAGARVAISRRCKRARSAIECCAKTSHAVRDRTEESEEPAAGTVMLPMFCVRRQPRASRKELEAPEAASSRTEGHRSESLELGLAVHPGAAAIAVTSRRDAVGGNEWIVDRQGRTCKRHGRADRHDGCKERSNQKRSHRVLRRLIEGQPGFRAPWHEITLEQTVFLWIGPLAPLRLTRLVWGLAAAWVTGPRSQALPASRAAWPRASRGGK